MRHGIAEDAVAGMADADRALTEEGRRQTARAVAGLMRLIEPPVVIVSSPKVRAMQTAKIVAEAFGGSVETEAALGDGAADEIIAAMATVREGTIIAVGHEPTLSQAAERLCFGRMVGCVQLKKAGCICVALTAPPSPGTAMLQWLATPKMLRQLAD